jgi:hypothetical protein
LLTFLNPFAFLALLGLLVPLAIHLWNRRPGREVAVGSLRWLAASANRRLRHLRLEQVALLLLRMALLAVLALAMAGPAWRRTHPGSRGVVLLSPAVAGNPALATLRPTIDSLRRRGYALRWLTARFPAVPSAQWRADSLRPPGLSAGDGRENASEQFLWARVQQAAGAFAGQPLYVVSTARLVSFADAHPALPTPGRITWQVLPARQPGAWVQQAALGSDSLRLWVGQSDDTRTTYRRVAVRRATVGQALTVPGLPGARLMLQSSNQLLIKPIAGGNALAPDGPVPVLTQPLRVAVYAGPGYAEDARRMRAALRAAALGLPQPLVLTAAPAPSAPLPKLDWLVWLADAPLPAAWRAAAASQGVRVWQQGPGTGQADTVRLAVAAAANAPLIALYRRTPAAPNGEPLWQDGRGRPVLSRQRVQAGLFYTLHTRLLPAWGELADSPALPALLLDVLLAEPGPVPRDQRALDPAQLPKTALPPLRQPLPPPTFRLADLRPGLVLVAALLFLLERLLARRRESQVLSTSAP